MQAVKNIFGNDKTFKSKVFSKNPKLQAHLTATFGILNIREAVVCPPGEDFNEWIAVNTVDFYNQTNTIYKQLEGICTDESCPCMNAGPKYQYLWADGEVIVKPIKCSAPEYVDYLMSWIQSKLEDSSVFPARLDQQFTGQFLPTVKSIFKRIFRVYRYSIIVYFSHVYYNHFKALETTNSDEYLNISFKHFVFFSEEHQLIEEKELKPLSLLIKNIHQKEKEYKEKFSNQKENQQKQQAKIERHNLLNQQFYERRMSHQEEGEEKHQSDDAVSYSTASVPEQEFEYTFQKKHLPHISEENNYPVLPTLDEFAIPSPPAPITLQRKVAEESNLSLPVVSKSIENDHHESDDSAEVVNLPMTPQKSPEKSPSSITVQPNAAITQAHSVKMPKSPVSPNQKNFINDDPLAEKPLASIVKANKSEQSLIEVPNVEQPVIRSSSHSSLMNTQNSLYFDGLTVEKNKSDFWTISTIGDISQEVKKALDDFLPNVSILGTGFDSEIHLQMFRAAGYFVSSVYSADGNGQEWAGLHGIPNYYSDLKELLTHEDVHVLYLSADAFQHEEEEQKAEFLIDQFKSKDRVVYVSPLSLPLSKRKKIISSTDNENPNQISLITFHPYRFQPTCQRVKEAIRKEQMCGRLHFIQINMQNRWKWEVQECFDQSDEQEMHQFMFNIISDMTDLIFWLLEGDSFKTIHSSFNSLDPDVPLKSDYATLHFETMNNISGIINISLINGYSPASFRLEAIGTEGQINISDNKVFFSPHTVGSGKYEKSLGHSRNMPKLLLDDKSAETSFRMPLQLLSSASLHLSRALKLYLFDKLYSLPVNPNPLSSNQQLIVEELLANQVTIAEGFRNIRVIEAIKRQQMLNRNFYLSVTELLKTSPAMIQEMNEKMNETNVDVDQTVEETVPEIENVEFQESFDDEFDSFLFDGGETKEEKEENQESEHEELLDEPAIEKDIEKELTETKPMPPPRKKGEKKAEEMEEQTSKPTIQPPRPPERRKNSIIEEPSARTKRLSSLKGAALINEFYFDE